MAKLIFMNIPAHGHVNPTLPVVQELIRREHEVIYYNTPEFGNKIAYTGAEFRPYPEPNPTAAEISGKAENIVNFSLLMLAETQRLLPFTLAEVERERPHLIVFDSLCLWGQHAANRLSVANAASISHLILEDVAGFTWRDRLHVVRHALPHVPRLLKLRRQLVRNYGDAIFPAGDIFPALGERNLLFTSRQFQPETPFIDDSFRFVGPALDADSRPAIDFPFDALGNGPLVYISLGTVHQRRVDFYRATLATLVDFPAHFVLSVGKQTDPADLAPIPDNFIVRPEVPQLALLPRVNLFVTHGGINSVQEGLYFGVPLVVAPQQFEQMFNGRQVVAHGAGIMVNDRPPYGRVNGDELRTAVQTVLADEAYRAAAGRIGDSLQQAGGSRRAADEIEQVAQRADSQQMLRLPS